VFQLNTKKLHDSHVRCDSNDHGFMSDLHSSWTTQTQKQYNSLHIAKLKNCIIQIVLNCW